MKRFFSNLPHPDASIQDDSCRLRLSQVTFGFKFPDLPSEVRTGMSLLAKLRELREARDAGFISEAEEAHAKGPVAVAVTCRLFLRCVPTQMGSPCYSGYAFSLRPALRGTTAGKNDFWAQ